MPTPAEPPPPAVSLREYIEAIVTEKEKSLWRALDNIKASIITSASDLSKRLDGMNEFRDALRDTNALNMPRKEVESLVEGIRQRIDRKDSETDNRIKSLENSRANNEGRLWTIGAAVVLVNLAIAVISFVVRK